MRSNRHAVVRLYRWQPRGLPIGRRWVDDAEIASAHARFLTDADLLVLDLPVSAASVYVGQQEVDSVPEEGTWYCLPPHVIRAARPLAVEAHARRPRLKQSPRANVA